MKKYKYHAIFIHRFFYFHSFFCFVFVFIFCRTFFLFFFCINCCSFVFIYVFFIICIKFLYFLNHIFSITISFVKWFYFLNGFYVYFYFFYFLLLNADFFETFFFFINWCVCSCEKVQCFFVKWIFFNNFLNLKACLILILRGRKGGGNEKFCRNYASFVASMTFWLNLNEVIANIGLEHRLNIGIMLYLVCYFMLLYVSFS